MELDIKPWDAAEHLFDEREIAGYLAVVMDDQEQPPMIGHAIGLVARARGGFAILAEESRIPEEELIVAASSNDRSGLPTLQKLERAYANLAGTRMVA